MHLARIMNRRNDSEYVLMGYMQHSHNILFHGIGYSF